VLFLAGQGGAERFDFAELLTALVLERFGVAGDVDELVFAVASGGFRLAVFRLGLLDGLQITAAVAIPQQMPDQDASHDKKEGRQKRDSDPSTHLWLSAGGPHP